MSSLIRSAFSIGTAAGEGRMAKYNFKFHVDKKGRVNFAQTDMLIHVVNRDTNRILDVERVIQMIDENKEQLRNLFRNYNVMDVQPATAASAPEDLSALQMAIIILAILLFLAAMLFIFMNWYYRTVHKRKLKAIVAGSTALYIEFQM
ncbi:unnamed protein product [Ranitomeya imitator]|uniref:Uncharacterized protein n=1 Tax=Ranitomeya imitator TaxID=111125 RepID=A0ABN9L514_9NEOB|nr:unnamed protein product [Ranitomeya imitator]